MIWLSVTPKSNAQFISEAILDNLDKAGVPEPDDVRHPSSRRYPITFQALPSLSDRQTPPRRGT